jgi:HSP20 family protein
MLMRPYAGWMSPWRDMERLRREMNRLFNDWPTRSRWGTAPSYPAINVWTEEDSAVVTAELPGALLENIDISVEDNMLTLRGDRQPDEMKEGAIYHRQERRYGTFLRTFQLPFRVDAENVEATFMNGVLNIVLPRAEEDKPKKIAVRAG